MNEIAWGCALFVGLATLLHVASTALVIYRSRRAPEAPAVAEAAAADLPRVSLLRPVCGLDPYDELTLRSGFLLAYERYELILCCEDADDPIIPVIRRLMGEHAHVDAKLLIGCDTTSANPKLNNLMKGWREARYSWVVMADSNVLMPADYLQRLLATWRADTGLVCAPPIGSMPEGFWAEVECAFLNTYQARWQYAADTVGLGFAQGKSMLWRRVDLDRAGGMRALGDEIAEDAAATKVVRRAGKRVRLVDRAFGQPLGVRKARQVWSRQVRWARLRRATFPAYFLPEILSGSAAPFAATVYAAEAFDVTSVGSVAVVASVWYGCEAALAHAAGWHTGLLSPLAWVARDAMLPVLWVQAWLSNSFSWRGNQMRLAGALPNG